MLFWTKKTSTKCRGKRYSLCKALIRRAKTTSMIKLLSELARHNRTCSYDAKRIIQLTFHRLLSGSPLLRSLANTSWFAAFPILRSAGGERSTLPPARFYHNVSREDISWKARSSLLPTVPKRSSSSFLIGDQSEGHSFSS